MKKIVALLFSLGFLSNVYAWWDPGHMVTAMIAYLQLDDQARVRVDELTKVLERDYPAVNHFVVTGPWPDDLKAQGVHAYDTWHYTNIPHNWQGVPLPPKQEVDVLWAIGEARSVLRSSRSKEVDKARFLGFLVHFVSDIHQPLHSTSEHNDLHPSGNKGGNGFALSDSPWRNLHMLWDAAGGYLDDYNDIRPYGKPQEPLTDEEIKRVRQLAQDLMRAYPKTKFQSVDELDPDFWALESHKLAVRYGYRGVNAKDNRGRNIYLESGGTPSELYLENVREIARQRLVLSGYRLGKILNDLFGQPTDSRAADAEEVSVLKTVQQLLDAINNSDPDLARPILHSEAVFYSIRDKDGKPSVGVSKAKQFLSNLKKDQKKRKNQYFERIWEPEISIQGEMANVRAPYDFHVDNQFSHCGVDVFNLLKTAEGWKVTSITYDVLKTDCPPSPLGPVGNGGMNNE